MNQSKSRRRNKQTLIRRRPHPALRIELFEDRRVLAGGILDFANTYGSGQAEAVAMQADGRIVVAGTNGSNTVVSRFRADGSPDTTFGSGGSATIYFNGAQETANDILIQPSDGKIIVGGHSRISGDFDFTLARLNSDGSLDTSFSNDGMLTTDFNGYDDSIQALALDSNGSIVVVGYGTELSGVRFAVARYTSSGFPDTTFSGDGKVLTQMAGSDDRAYGVAIQSDRNIVVGGTSILGSANSALARYRSDNGALDTTFDGDGRVVLDASFISANDEIRDLLIQPDGKIVTVGTFGSGISSVMGVVRYNTNGSLDNGSTQDITPGDNFSGDGRQTVAVTSEGTEGYAIDRRADGKLVFVGNAVDQSVKRFAAAQLNVDGTSDTYFGNSGSVYTAVGGFNANAKDVTLQSNGDLLLAGSASNGSSVTLVRYRTAPPTVTSTSVDSGSIAAGATSITVTFSEPVSSPTTSTNYRLQRAGTDGLLGTTDDVIINSSSVSYVGTSRVATVTYPALAEDAYRFTVTDEVTSEYGRFLDGDLDGIQGGNRSRDFLVGGQVKIWGNDISGNFLSPSDVAGLTNIVSVVAGEEHKLALRSDGTVWAWGTNTFGQLGDGTTTNRLSPVQVNGLTNVIAISAGHAHSMAVRSDGTVRSWGQNLHGQLGDGTNNDRLTPVTVTGLTGVTAIDLGYYHSIALKSDGTIRTWGYNGFGQLGNGTTINRTSPITVSGLSSISRISASQQSSFAVRSDGTIHAWGGNSAALGYLGDGTSIDRLTPVAISGVTTAVDIAGDFTHTLALLADGTILSWGTNSSGALGDGTTTTRTSPVSVVGITNATKIAVGVGFSMALLSDGTIKSWGQNSSGQLGIGSTTGSLLPTTVSTINSATVVSASYFGSIALRTPAVQPIVTIEFSSGSASIYEVSGASSLKLLVTGTVSTPQSVQLVVTNGDATPATDFNFTSVINIPAGTYDGTSATAIPITITSIPDAILEGDERVEFTLVHPTLGVKLGDANSNTATTAVHTLTIDESVPRVVSTSFINDGRINAGSTSITVSFSEPVVGATTASNYQLRRAGTDALLGTSDDPIVPINSVTMSGIVATLQFSPLSTEDVYRLTVLDSITDLAETALDGDSNGIGGGIWRRDFVVAESVSSGSTTVFPVETGTANDYFGAAVGISSDKFIVGEFGHDVGGLDIGIAYVYDATSGLIISTLNNPTSVAGDQFGAAVAISGSLALVANRFNDTGATNAGQAYLYSVATGQHIRTLSRPAPVAANDNFGVSVALSETRAVVGAHNVDGTAGADEGRAFLYNALSGQLIATLASPTPEVGERFGVSVAISDDYVVVGGYLYGAADIGRAYVFDANTGAYIRTLTHSSLQNGDEFGARVAISGNRIAIDAPGADFNVVDEGAILIFDAATGNYLRTIHNPNPSVNDSFDAPALAGNYVLVGAQNDDFGATDAGYAYLFDVTTGGLVASFPNPSPATDDAFGYAVAMSETRIVIGAYNDDTQNANQGAAYLYSIGRTALSGHSGQVFDLDNVGAATGQLIQGTNNAFDSLNRLYVGGSNYQPATTLPSTPSDDGRTTITPTVLVSGIKVHREITVPSSGTYDFARSIEVLTNPTSASITTPVAVRIVGNLGSDASTTVFATSDGDTIVEPTDWWIGTDDGNNTGGTPAIIHLIHGPAGLVPTSVLLTEDNIEWTYNTTFVGNETKRLASFTIAGSSRQIALNAVNALINSLGFGGQAMAHLTPLEEASIANFDFPTVVTSTSIDGGVLSTANTSLSVTFNDPMYLIGTPGGESLVGWWTGNNTPNDSASSFHGTLTNGTTYATGLNGNAFSFDGVNDYVQIGSSTGLVTTNGMTLEAWVNSPNPARGSTQVIVNKEGEYQIGLTGSGEITLALANTVTSNFNTIRTGYLLPANQWKHMALSYNGSEIILYVDGSKAYSIEANGVIGDSDASQNDLRIGGRQASSSQYFIGKVDELGLYDRALTADEIYGLYLGENAGTARNSPTNFSLSRAGADGLLGTADDIVIPFASIQSTTTTSTLSIASLPEDVYRLTASSGITDFAGNALDGNGDGVPGDSWRRDFVVDRYNPSLSSTWLPTVSAGQPDSQFGAAVAVDGNLRVVGAPSADLNGQVNVGVAYIFSATTGALVATLANPTPAANDFFGYSVAISDNTVVVGMYDASPPASGSAYVFDATTGALIATLVNPTQAVGDFFGASVAISGNTVVVGAFQDNNGATISGSAFVFNATTGALIATLSNPTPAESDLFGYNVAISGNTVVVGAYLDDAGATNSGSAYLFNATTGALITTLANPTPAESDLFGYDVAISGNTVVVGAYLDAAGATDSGSAYLFNATTGALIASLANPTPSANDNFGSSVAISGNIVVVGAGQDNTSATYSGSVYFFNATTGTLVATLANPTPASGDLFGCSVAISGNSVVVGAYRDDTGGQDSGRAYVFDSTTRALIASLANPTPGTRNYFASSVAISESTVVVGNRNNDITGIARVFDATTGALITGLTNPTPATSEHFGSSVAISGNTVVVGAFGDDNGAVDSGSAYLFNATTGALIATLTNPTPAASDYFGISVAISGNIVVVGATGDDTGATDSGIAYAFNATTGALIATLANPTPATNDYFGLSVAISGNTVVVGATRDDTGATDSGSTYAFNATTGALITTLANPTPATDDYFGSSVAISGSTVVVGANGDNTGATDSGSAYVFNATTGASIASLTNPTPAASDYFGSSVAISGNTVVVGAYQDDTVATDTGSVYAFDATTGALVATLANPTPAASDFFGYATAIFDNQVVVGADQDDTQNTDQGAAYLFSPEMTSLLTGPNGFAFDLDRSTLGTGQILHGTSNAFDGLNRMSVNNSAYQPLSSQLTTTDDVGRTIVTPSVSMSALTVHREVTVPNTGNQDFVRTIDVFENTTGSSIAVPVRIVGNLGSDASTTVFATSDGDLNVEATDWWFGTDDDNPTGGIPAIVHLLHGPFGVQPSNVTVTGDNVEWTYNVTFAPNETKRLATFTVLGNTRQEAIDAANVLVTSSGFGGEAATFLTAGELASLANFHFNVAPTDIQVSSSSIAENSGANAAIGNLSSTDANSVEGDTHTYSLVSGTGSTDNAAFTIVGNSLKAVANLDFETKSSYSIRIRSTDLYGGFFERAFTITVSDVAEYPPTVTNTSFLATGTLPSNTSNLTVTFNEPVLNANIASIYVLRRAGTDGLLGSADDPTITITSALIAGNVATLNFGPLVEDIYRLTISDAITGPFGMPLDGDENGAAGGNWRKDFVVNHAAGWQPDSSFDNDGILTTAIGTANDFVRSVAVQSDGKIVVAGNSFVSVSLDIAVARYNSDGTLDNSFSGDGKLTTAIGSLDVASSMVIQSDSKIVVAGHTHISSDLDFALVRYNVDGTLDTSFDGDGKLTTAVGISNDAAFAMALQSDGKIVVAGYSNNGSDDDIALVRYNADGSLDSTFDGDGKLTMAVGVSNDEANSVAIQNDGKIVVAGTSLISGSQSVAVVRFNSDGSLDNSFDGDGKLTTSLGTSVRAGSIVLQNDGKIVIAGSGSTGSGDDFVVFRYNPDGSLDPTFDSDGKVTTAVGFGQDLARGIVLQSDGKIVVSGSTYNGSNTDFAVVRYNSDGALDTTFDGDGKLLLAIGASNDQAEALALQSDGKLVVAGRSSNGVNDDFAIVRFGFDNASLSLESTSAFLFNFDRRSLGTGQLLQGTANAFDGLNRLIINGSHYEPAGTSSTANGGRTLVTPSATHSGLTVHREITVPSMGISDFARTLDVLHNPTASSITAPVSLLGNLGSDASTTVFATSDGDMIVETTDWWFGTDDDNPTGGTPAIVHFLHGPFGVQPSNVTVTGDNVEWTYNVTFAPNETRRLATFTVLGSTRQQAINAANALVTSTGFGGEAAAFLTAGELASLANFRFNTSPTDIQLSASSIAENNVPNVIVGTFTSADVNIPDGDTFGYSLVTGTGSADNGAFTIDGTQLKANAAFDFETKSSYNIRVRTTDAGGLSFDKALVVVVNDVNEAPSVELENIISLLAENSNSSSRIKVADIKVVDDALGTETFSIVGTDASSFEIDGLVLYVKAGVSLDFETKVNYSISIQVDDASIAGTPDGTVAYALALTDVNEFAVSVPVDTDSNVDGISETAPVGSIVGLTARSVDLDGTNNAVTYSLVDSSDGRFHIHPSTGVITLAIANLDFETANMLSIVVRATSADGSTAQSTFGIPVADVNEPVVLTRDSAVVSGSVSTALTNTGTWADPENGTVTLSASQGTVTKNANGTWSWSFTPTTYMLNQTITISANDGTNVSTVTFVATAFASVQARSVFYNNSTGSLLSSAGAAQAAIDTSKSALRVSGTQSSFASYTNYSRGLNGVIVDIAGLPATATASDVLSSLQFAQWNGIAAGGFAALSASAIPTVTLFPGSGANGSTRVKITFPDNTIQNTWLRVTVLANGFTGLQANDQFYFGHVLADVDVGNTATRYRVNADDVSAIRANQSGFPNTANVTNRYDLNKDGRVNADDVSIVRANQQGFGIVAPIIVP